MNRNMMDDDATLVIAATRSDGRMRQGSGSPPKRNRGRTWLIAGGAALALVIVVAAVAVALRAGSTPQPTTPTSTSTALTAAGMATTGRATASAATATSATAPVQTNVYVGASETDSPNKIVYALNAVDGSVRWWYEVGAESGLEIAAANGIVYALGQVSGSMTALDAQSGQVIWHATTHANVDTQPVAEDDAVFVTSSGASGVHGYIDAYRASDGKLLWERDLGSNNSAELAVSNGVVYANTFTVLQALRASDGSVLWQWQRALASGGVGPPCVIGEVVYINGYGEVWAINTADGSQKWHYKPPTLASPGDTRVSAASDLVFAGNVHNLNALHASDGVLAWHTTYTRIVDGTSAYNGVVYVSVGTLVALNAATGTQLWSASLSGAEGWAPVLSDGMLFESRSDSASAQPSGYIYALNPANGAVLWKFSHGGEVYGNLIVM